MALAAQPQANLALISTPGEYAAAEALKALRLGLHVMLFSDNVTLEDEVMLKREAERRGLMVMGPDCGTAIVAGVPLGFANSVRRGPIGVDRRFGHRTAAGDLADRPGRRSGYRMLSAPAGETSEPRSAAPPCCGRWTSSRPTQTPG